MSDIRRYQPGSAGESEPERRKTGQIITSVQKLLAVLGWRRDLASGMERVARIYPLKVTAHFLSLANKDDPMDPLLRQILPDPAELAGQGAEDPTNELAQQRVKGLVHRYPDRVLLLTTHTCFIHCRHCNRKRYWAAREEDFDLDACISYIRGHSGVREAIVSGGDPLTLPRKRLEEILDKLAAIDTLEVIRIGTRALSAEPAAVDDEVCRILSRHAPIWINTHFNHSSELSEETMEAIQRLRSAGALLNNQSVLLKGINDDTEVIGDLNRKLVSAGIRPYYLYHCDPVRGALHFRTSVNTGLEIISRLRGTMSGLAQPFYAVDLPMGRGKVNLEPDSIVKRENGRLLLKTFDGGLEWYQDQEP